MRTTVTEPADAQDLREIRRLVDRYAIGADRRDGDAVAALFIPDGSLLIHSDGDPDGAPDRERHGRAEMSAAIASLSRYRRTFHLVGQHVADLVDDDRATAITYCEAHHVTDGEPPTDRVMLIRYLDELVRTDDGTWRFALRRLVVDLTDTHPLT